MNISTQQVLEQKSLELFYKASESSTLTKWFKENFLSHIIC